MVVGGRGEVVAAEEEEGGRGRAWCRRLRGGPLVMPPDAIW